MWERLKENRGWDAWVQDEMTCRRQVLHSPYTTFGKAGVFSKATEHRQGWRGLPARAALASGHLRPKHKQRCHRPHLIAPEWCLPGRLCSWLFVLSKSQTVNTALKNTNINEAFTMKTLAKNPK